MVRISLIGLFTLVTSCIFLITERAVRSEEQNLIDAVVGTWALVSLYDEDDRALAVLTFGDHPEGRLMLDRDGNFSFLLVNDLYRPMPRCTSGDLVVTRASAGPGTLAYFGRYTINSRKVIHLQVEHGVAPTVEATVRTADVTVADGQMTFLSSMTASLTGSNYSNLVWKRVRRIT
jgi:Lipocalin-like domain